MRAFLIIAFLIGSLSTTWGQTVYYATFSGKNYEEVTWRSSSLAAFKAASLEGVYESYTVDHRRDGTTVVHRDYSTPSGDWTFQLTYEFGRDALLRTIQSEFVTFSGISDSGDNEGLTRCVSHFAVTDKGEIHKTSERITEAKSGKIVARKFFQPQIKHWMSLNQLPVPIKD